jgi:hypothetical protein
MLSSLPGNSFKFAGDIRKNEACHRHGKAKLKSLSLGETKDMAIYAIEAIQKEPARQNAP